jgi:hypothetical protein
MEHTIDKAVFSWNALQTGLGIDGTYVQQTGHDIHGTIRSSAPFLIYPEIWGIFWDNVIDQAHF